MGGLVELSWDLLEGVMVFSGISKGIQRDLWGISGGHWEK